MEDSEGLGDDLAHVAHRLGVAVVHGRAQRHGGGGSGGGRSGGGSRRGFALLFQIAQGDAAAQTGALSAALIAGAGRGGDDEAAVDQLLHVAGNDAAVGAGGHDLRKIGAALLGQRAGAGRDVHIAHDNGGLSDFLGLGIFGRGARGFGGGRGLGGGGGSAAGIKLGERFAAVADDHDVGQAGHVVALVEEDRQHGAGFLGFLIEGSLVRFIGEQYVADCNAVADLLVPFGNDTTFNRLTLTGHNDRCRHIASSCR